AVVVNDARWSARSEVLWEKGTNRTQFFRGAVDKYTWVDVGSSYLPSEVTAAFLLAQLERAQAITERRLAVWARYHDAFAALEARGLVRRPIVPADCRHHGHLYYLLFADLASRTAAQAWLRGKGIDAIFHYIPLHSSPAGRRFAKTAGSLPVTERTADRLLRLPIWAGMTEAEQSFIIDAVERSVAAHA